MHSVIKMTEYKTISLLAAYFIEKFLHNLRPGNKSTDTRLYLLSDFYS